MFADTQNVQAERVCVLQCSDKPADPDKYGFSNFARMLMSGKGLNPLPSDSRRRPDRAALQVGPTCSFPSFSYSQHHFPGVYLTQKNTCVSVRHSKKRKQRGGGLLLTDLNRQQL